VTGATRRTIGAAAAALLVGVTMALVAIAGEGGSGTASSSGPDPAFPLLADEPLTGASGTVALLRDAAVRCVAVVDAASGAARDLRCERDLTADPPRWTADGRVEVLRYDGDELEALVLDASDGTVDHRRLVPHSLRFSDRGEPGRSIAADGSRLVVGADEDRTWLDVVSPAGETERIVEAPIVSWSGFRDPGWSPDDRLALVQGRSAAYLVEVGTGEARVLLTGARGAVWRPEPVSNRDPPSTASAGGVSPPPTMEEAHPSAEEEAGYGERDAAGSTMVAGHRRGRRGASPTSSSGATRVSRRRRLLCTSNSASTSTSTRPSARCCKTS
jgi:hypothetical protein